MRLISSWNLKEDEEAPKQSAVAGALTLRPQRQEHVDPSACRLHTFVAVHDSARTLTGPGGQPSGQPWPSRGRPLACPAPDFASFEQPAGWPATRNNDTDPWRDPTGHEVTI